MRVIVADDSVLLREGVTRLLENAGFEVVGHAADQEPGLERADDHGKLKPGDGRPRASPG